MVPAILCVLLIRLLKPLVVVRLRGIDIGRIGGMYPAEWYLAQREAGMHKEKCFDIFYFITNTGCISNRQWLKMWKRVLRVFPFWAFARMVDRVNKRLPGFGGHVIPINHALPMYGREYKGLECARCVLNYKKPSISFTPQEELLGEALLGSLGIPEGKRFVCFHARDPVYLNTVFPEQDWSYHDYRDSDINNYLPAVEELTQQGIYALRMGAIVEKKLQSNNPLIIDYAMNGKRTDFLDVYLGARCHFFLCSDAGISIIPEMFRWPVVYVNWVPLLGLPSFYVLNGILIPKKFYLRKEQRFLSFKEIIGSEIGTGYYGEIFERLGIELIENTPQEIMAVTGEMEARLQGTWKTTREDEKLQQDFWALFADYQLKFPDFTIGADFLRQNKELLNPPEKMMMGQKLIKSS